MKLTNLIWQCENRSPHQVIRADFWVDDIAQALAVADGKLKYINAHSPGGIKRSPAVIRSRSIAGKLADYSVKQVLLNEIAAKNPDLQVQEYDEIRTDNFQQPDKYDLRIIDAKAAWDVEIRSSFCYKLRDEKKIIQKLSTYGWYTSYNKPIEPPRDFYWQFIYYMRPESIDPNEAAPNIGVFEDQVDNGKVHGYIVGGATKDMLQSGQAVQRSDQDGALYQSLSPICSGMDASEILRATLSKPEQKLI